MKIKQRSIATLALSSALAALPLAATAADYVVDVDGAHASVNFQVSHLGYSFINGRFNDFEGEFSYDADNLAASKISMTVNTASLDSNHAERDKHLTGSRFINASKFPEASFTSTKVTDLGNGNFTVEGDMTLYGTTKSIMIDAAFIGEGKDPWGGYRAGFEGTTRLELADFGIPVVGASSYVDLEIQVEGIRQ